MLRIQLMLLHWNIFCYKSTKQTTLLENIPLAVIIHDGSANQKDANYCQPKGCKSVGPLEQTMGLGLI